MYLSAVHAETDLDALRQFIRDNPLGILVSAIPSETFPTIQSTHIPWVLDYTPSEDGKSLGTLRGHMARANPHAKALGEATRDAPGGVLEQEVYVLFNGPAHSYVTPKFYVETKPTTGKVVPTWNYSAVQAYGRATVHFDAKDPVAQAFLQTQIGDLSQQSETKIMGYTGGDRPAPWAVSDAPVPYTELLKKAIIGIEIEIQRLEGKYKMSQEMREGDRKGVVEGFKALKTDVGDEMAKTVETRGEMKSQRSKAA